MFICWNFSFCIFWFFDGFVVRSFEQTIETCMGSFCLIHLDTLLFFLFLEKSIQNLANCTFFFETSKNGIKKFGWSQKTSQIHVQIKIAQCWYVSYNELRNIIHWTIETFKHFMESYFCQHTKQSLFTLFLLIQTRAPTSWEFLTSLQYHVSRILNLVTQRYCHFSEFYEWIFENKVTMFCGWIVQIFWLIKIVLNLS
jgi:hypothetical protein